MKTNNTTNLPLTDGIIYARLRQVWTMYITRICMRGLGWLVAVFVGIVFIDFALDWGCDLSGYWRLFLLALNLTCLGWVAYRWIIRFLHRFDPLKEALRIERAHPDLNGLLVSGVQFHEESIYGSEVSRELMRAVRQQAENCASTLNLRAIVRRVVLRTALISAALALLVLVGFGTWYREYLVVLAQRMLNPFSQTPYPTFTKLEVLSGDVMVCSGEPVTVRARATGVIPRTGKLAVRYGLVGWDFVPLESTDPEHPGEFTYTFTRTREDLDYYFRAGDGRSSLHQIKVVHPPRMDSSRVQITYPAYTKMAPQEVDTLNLKVPEGTQLVWRLKFNEKVLGAELLMDGVDPVPLQLADNGREASASMPALASRSYQIGFKWRMGSRDYNEPGVRYYIQVIPDSNPQVSLVEPSEDGKATLKKVVHLAYTARDDYGLGKASVVFSVNDGAELRQDLGAMTDSTQAQATYAWAVTTKFPGLKEGDLLTFAIEVTDNRPGEAGKNRSLSRRIQFVSDKNYLEYILSRQRKNLGQLRPIYLQQKNAVQELSKSKGEKP